jgi:hypothetical protein
MKKTRFPSFPSKILDQSSPKKYFVCFIIDHIGLSYLKLKFYFIENYISCLFHMTSPNFAKLQVQRSIIRRDFFRLFRVNYSSAQPSL